MNLICVRYLFFIAVIFFYLIKNKNEKRFSELLNSTLFFSAMFTILKSMPTIDSIYCAQLRIKSTHDVLEIELLTKGRHDMKRKQQIGKWMALKEGQSVLSRHTCRMDMQTYRNMHAFVVLCIRIHARNDKTSSDCP